MSALTPTYSFLPWLRQGVANKIAAADFDAAVKLRATIQVELNLAGQKDDGSNLTKSLTRTIQLFGPGDIVGIESRAIFKTEPHDWITNFEPNYLPYVDFYDEDFPWRYTPTAPDPTSKHLRPWIMLVVLKEGEFEEGANIKGKPLPFIKVADKKVFPPAEQLWAWAHVHVNGDLMDNQQQVITSTPDAALLKLQKRLSENSDLAYSRILCPRKLEENMPYHAFLVPVFESGRLAGLGLDPNQTPNASFSSWANYTSGNKEEPDHFPVYFRRYFRTGTVGDFEYLVRLLEPKIVDARVGTRDMDVQDPGSNLPGITDQGLGGVLKLGGALRVPPELRGPEAEKYDKWARPYPHPFQEALAAFINLADDYATTTAEEANRRSGLVGPGPDAEDPDDVDPLITPPLYGRWHALTQRLLKDRAGHGLSPNDNWVHELNLDPRYRVTAGLGAQVVQKNQEEYMNAAWEQVGQVLEANRRIRAAQLAKEVSWTWYHYHLQPLHSAAPERAFALTAPIQNRVLTQGLTVYHHVNVSMIPLAAISAPMRRIVRPRGRLMRALPFDDTVTPGNLLKRINEGEVSAAPPKQAPPGVVTVNDVAREMLPKSLPALILDWLRRHRWLIYAPLIIALLVALVLLLLRPAPAWVSLGGMVVAAMLYLFRRLRRLVGQMKQADAILEQNQTPEAVDSLPHSPNFVLSAPGSGFTPSLGSSDSAEALLFKLALKDMYTMIGASTAASEQPPRAKLDMTGVASATIAAINPDLTIPRYTWNTIGLPARIEAALVEGFKEAMVYPQIDAPMYKPLIDISAELFLPSINLVEQNSITLLQPNQKFIEAYMVGINHEFARELLWRGYPTDQRGSSFRQFWDITGYLHAQSAPGEELKEKLRDISPIHEWPNSSRLGDHDHRKLQGEKKEEVVLVIRGELLKKYPTAVIYAQRAEWQRKPNGRIDNTGARVLVKLSETQAPTSDQVKTFLYSAKVEPDVYLFGFDLTVEKAKGDTGESETDDPGWFFVIEERPGEPRFGLDLAREGELNVWNDLSWKDVLPGAPAGAFIEINDSTPSLNLIKPTGQEVQEKQQQYDEDRFVAWDKNASSADLAYILYQAPVRVAIHAAELLTKK